VPHRPLNGRLIDLSANRVRFVGNPEVIEMGTKRISTEKSASRHVGFAAEVKLRSERMSVI
jgi:hypothetical protein